jgi:hypothetical protein
MNLTQEQAELLEAELMSEISQLSPELQLKLSTIVDRYTNTNDPQTLLELQRELKGL